MLHVHRQSTDFMCWIWWMVFWDGAFVYGALKTIFLNEYSMKAQKSVVGLAIKLSDVHYTYIILMFQFKDNNVWLAPYCALFCAQCGHNEPVKLVERWGWITTLSSFGCKFLKTRWQTISFMEFAEQTKKQLYNTIVMCKYTNACLI